MSELERRYARLLRLFYPAEYRRARETEVVDTYLELAGPHRRWPSAGDVADVAAGGLRQHVRAAGATGLGPGLRLAAPLALLTATALAGAWTVSEFHPPPPEVVVPRFGPFVSPGIVVWAAWLLAAAVHLAWPGRRTRIALGVAVAATAAVVPVAALAGQLRPPLFMLLPQLALGIVALAGTGRAGAPLRLLPLAAGATAAYAAMNIFPDGGFYLLTRPQVLSTAGTLLLAVAALLGIGLAVRGDRRGGWAFLVLLGPVGMLSLHPLAGALAGEMGGTPNPDWRSLVTTAVAVGVIGPALVALAVAARRRPGHHCPPAGRCTACGAPGDTTNRPTPT